MVLTSEGWNSRRGPHTTSYSPAIKRCSQTVGIDEPMSSSLGQVVCRHPAARNHKRRAKENDTLAYRNGAAPMTIPTSHASGWTDTAVEFATRAFRKDLFRWTKTRRLELHNAIEVWSHEGERAPQLRVRPTPSKDAREVPEFLNDVGANVIWIGALAFSCVGASPPDDHPRIYLNMKGTQDILCPYCSTHFLYRAALGRR